MESRRSRWLARSTRSGAELGMIATAAYAVLAAMVANSTRVDAVLRRILPGISSAATVVPLAFVSVAAGEFPLHLLAAEAGVAGVLAPKALRTRGGRLAAAAIVASWAGLVAAQHKANQAPEIFDRALRDALGQDFDKDLPQAAAERDSATRLQDTWLPKLTERRRYLRHENLSYGPAGIRNHLDIWHREDLPADGRAPVLVQIHGSAWIAGSKRGQAYPLMAHMAERGWVCVAINYSLAPAARWPAHIIDVKRALTWVKQEIAGYGGDPGFVAVTGGSAGGHLTAMAALTANEPMFQPGFEDADTSVAAAVPIYGLYDLLGRLGDNPKEQEMFLSKIVIGQSPQQAPEVWEKGSATTWIRPDAPPFFILHGDNDTFAPVGQGRAFAERLRAVSTQPVAYAELPGAQHMWEALPSVRTAATVAAVDKFLSYLHQGYSQRITDSAPPSGV